MAEEPRGAVEPNDAALAEETADEREHRALDSLHEQEHLTVKVVGHQWWWEVSYDNSTAAYTVTTANEIHIPVGRPVLFKLTATDVIHSFWVPNLHGKMDLIPGHENVTWLKADQ